MANTGQIRAGSNEILRSDLGEVRLETGSAKDIKFAVNTPAGIKGWRIDGTTGDFIPMGGSGVNTALSNNSYLQSVNAAGSGFLDLLKADASDNTVLNAATSTKGLFAVNGTSIAGFTSNGVRINTPSIGDLSGLTGAITGGPLEVFANGNTVNTAIFMAYGNAANNPSRVVLAKTRGDVTGTNVIVQINDEVGGIAFAASSGDAYPTGAVFRAMIDGTPAAGAADMPMRLEVLTAPDGSGTAIRRWAFDSAGAFNQDGTNGADIVLAKASTSVRQVTSATVTAAGTTITDATQLTSVFNRISTAAAGTGVKLWDAGNGTMIAVSNLGANDLEVYPPNASGVINSAAAGVALTLAAATNQIGLFFKVSANTWFAMVGAGPDT